MVLTLGEYAALGGFALWLVMVFQVLVGLRWIHFHGRLHRTIHKWTGIFLVFAAPIHGAIAASYFIGFPFKLG